MHINKRVIVISILIALFLVSGQIKTVFKQFKGTETKWNQKEQNVDNITSTSQTVRKYTTTVTTTGLYNYSTEELQKTMKRSAVVIISRWRSGSSFLGEYFNQNPNAYYLFEPLHGVGYLKQDRAKRQLVLKGLFSCDYSNVTGIYNGSVNDSSAKCINNVCFAWKSKVLIKHGFCSEKTQTCRREPFSPEDLEEICRKSLFTTAKVVVSNLEELEPLVTNPLLDLKVIELVRDPRAVIPSQRIMVNKPRDKIPSMTKFLCNYYEDNIKYLRSCISPERYNFTHSEKSPLCNSSITDAWRGRFLRLSHEYLSEQPFEAWNLLYKFVGLEFNNKVGQWLRENTDAKNRSDGDSFFGTSRNSKTVLEKWRIQQNFSDVTAIQESCKRAMKELGYKAASSNSLLRNFSSKLYDLNKAIHLS